MIKLAGKPLWLKRSIVVVLGVPAIVIVFVANGAVAGAEAVRDQLAEFKTIWNSGAL